MTLERTRTRENPSPVEGTEAGPAASGGSDLVKQAEAYGNVPRQAHEDCEKGERAAKELENRRNASGQ